MENSQDLKSIVKETYRKIAVQSQERNASSCCGATTSSIENSGIMADDYSKLNGYATDADLGLGCGLPTQFANINKGDTVVDLGSGAGNDCFVARHETGIEGKVIGLDFTEEMIEKARLNAQKLNYNNVEFRFGDIENMPINNDTADVVVSNCVLNLVPNKKKAFEEIHRILKPGGHFSISDVVLLGELPKALISVAEMYAGCVTGAIQKDTYLSIVKDAGFENSTIQVEKPIEIPKDILSEYLSEDELKLFNSSVKGIQSITLFAQKTGGTKKEIPVIKETKCRPEDGCY